MLLVMGDNGRDDGDAGSGKELETAAIELLL
jgi:hypothetical protein